MQTNEVPAFDTTENETNCCPRFHPEPWDQQELHFDGGRRSLVFRDAQHEYAFVER